MRHAGFHGRAGFGHRPALIVVDVNVGFTAPESPLVCDLEDVVVAIRRLLEEARRAEIPIVFTTVSYSDGDKRTAAAFIEKVPALLTLEAGSRWVEIDPRLEPREDEPVLTKLFASAFFGTALSSLLAANGCDSLIVTGASTSGCVRATAVDALQHGFIPMVVTDAVGDRDETIQRANLFDLGQKYADLVDEATALEVVAR